MDILFFDKLITIIPIIVSILSAVISGKIYKINEKSNKDREEREKIHEVSQIFPYVLDSEYRLNSVKVCNNSDYPIYDVMILEGINTSNIYAGENCCQAEYIRLIIMGPLSRPRSKILRVAVSRIILSSEASKVKLVGNLVA